MYLDLATEAAVTDIVTSEFLNAVKVNLGFDVETPDSDLPVNVTALLHRCIQICEKEQWRFILRKKVTLSLPVYAFAHCDRVFVMPFGRVTALESFSYVKDDATTATVSAGDYTIYAHEPSKLWCTDWTALLSSVDTDQPYPITLSYYTGYASYAAVPKSTIQALTVLAYHLFEYRGSDETQLPVGYCQLRDHNLLNDRRAIQYIVDDWRVISRG
jgi:hypothetical protein